MLVLSLRKQLPPRREIVYQFHIGRCGTRKKVGYNFKRLLNLIGITLFRKLIIAIQEGHMEAIRAKIEEYITHFRLKSVYFLDFIGFAWLKLKGLKILA